MEVYVKPSHKPSGYEHYADNCRKHIIPIIGNTPLSDITPSMIQRFFNERSAHGNLLTGGPLSAKSIKNMRVVLDVALKQAVAEGCIAANPVPLTAIKHVRAKRVVALTDEEQKAIEECLFKSSSPLSRAEIFALFTGARRGEICALCWKDYNERTGTIHIERTVKRLKKGTHESDAPKTELVFCPVKSDSSDRSLALPEFLICIVKEQKIAYKEKYGRYPSSDDYIFFSTVGGIIDPDNLTRYHNSILKKLGLNHKKFHALRHTFATRGIENGIDVSTMSGLLGHADTTTTTHFYISPRESSMQKAMLGIKPVSA